MKSWLYNHAPHIWIACAGLIGVSFTSYGDTYGSTRWGSALGITAIIGVLVFVMPAARQISQKRQMAIERRTSLGYSILLGSMYLISAIGYVGVLALGVWVPSILAVVLSILVVVASILAGRWITKG